MRWFRWNSFTIIGLILLIIGVVGLIKGQGFEFDAGLPAEPFEGFYYLMVGALMVVNGVVLPRPLAEPVAGDSADTTSNDVPKRSGAASAPIQTK